MAREMIYVPLGGGPGDRTALEAAKRLAPLFDADIEAVFLGRDDAPVLMIAGEGFAGVGAAAIESLREERAAAEEAAKALGAELGVPVEVHKGVRANATAEARLAALAVVDPEAARGDGPLVDVFESLILEDGAPVFAPRTTNALKTVAVAWDGSREAARALKAAGPLLKDVETVRLIQAPGGVDFKDVESADLSHARRWIERRGGPVTFETIEVKGDIGKGIVESLRTGGGVDLLIAGAYGHTRLREAVFGGMTRTLLHAEGPSLLLAH